MKVLYGTPSLAAPDLQRLVEALTTAAGPLDSIFLEIHQREIAERAYLRAAARHFEPGHDVEDWLAAEAELRAAIYTD